MSKKKPLIILVLIIIFVILPLVVLYPLFSVFVPPIDNDKAIADYKEVFYNIEKSGIEEGKYKYDFTSEEYIKADVNGNIRVLQVSDNCKLALNRRSFRIEEKDIYLYISQGIIGQDYEVVYLRNLNLNIDEYDYIKKLDDNIYLCRIEYS